MQDVLNCRPRNSSSTRITGLLKTRTALPQCLPAPPCSLTSTRGQHNCMASIVQRVPQRSNYANDAPRSSLQHPGTIIRGLPTASVLTDISDVHLSMSINKSIDCRFCMVHARLARIYQKLMLHDDSSTPRSHSVPMTFAGSCCTGSCAT